MRSTSFNELIQHHRAGKGQNEDSAPSLCESLCEACVRLSPCPVSLGLLSQDSVSLGPRLSSQGLFICAICCPSCPSSLSPMTRHQWAFCGCEQVRLLSVESCFLILCVSLLPVYMTDSTYQPWAPLVVKHRKCLCLCCVVHLMPLKADTLRMISRFSPSQIQSIYLQAMAGIFFFLELHAL